MNIVILLRQLRHNKLKNFDRTWRVLGQIYQILIRWMPQFKTKQFIGKYGPFKLNPKFRFSDFRNWGSGHNQGFQSCIMDARGKKNVLDIGAHIGLVSLPLSTVVEGNVYAFEPARANLVHLYNHIKYNKLKNIKVFSCLIGAESSKQVEFYERDEATGMNSRVIKKDHKLYKKTLKSQMTIDEFCGENGIIPELIKIDVEGAEYDVLYGAKETLKTYDPIIYLSIHPKELELLGCSVSNLISLLSDLGYFSYDVYGKKIKQFLLSEYKFVKAKGSVS